MRHDHLFAFENDFVESLRCVPMAVRLKLDRAGVKLTLRQWSRFAVEERHALLHQTCDSPESIAAYRALLHDLVQRTGGCAAPLPEPFSPTWNAPTPPDAVTAFARSRDVTAPSAAEWRSLSELERFVLVKLSRDNHDNVNFAPALAEFRRAEVT